MRNRIFSCFMVVAVAAPAIVLAANWPQFRGPGARGVDDSAPVPVTWDIKTGENILWRTPIPGLAHAAPIIWGDRMYVTTAVQPGESALKVGLYGDIDSVKETVKNASSPVIYDGKVIVQCDVQKDSFLAVFDLADGRELWRTARTDVPTWSTPTVVRAAGRTQIAVNGWHHTGGYDFATGRELWKLDGGGDIPVPTPIAVGDIIYFTSAHGRERPMRAIRADASGDITPDESGRLNPAMVWNHERRGSYMQTPIVVGDLLFGSTDIGLLTCFDARTGDVYFSERLSKAGQGFTASPVSDGRHLYFASELGNVVVVPVKKTFAVAATNPIEETCLATPAIAGGTLFLRARNHLFAFGSKR